MPTLQHIQTDMGIYCFSDLLYCIAFLSGWEFKEKKIGSTDLSLMNGQI